MNGTMTPERINRVAEYLSDNYNEMAKPWDKAPEKYKSYWRDQAVSVLCEAMKNED